MHLPDARWEGLPGHAPARSAVLLLALPDTADELAEARRLGGLHRRKKKTVASIYGFSGLRTIEDNQALLETITVETFALENSVARSRALTQIVAIGAKLIEVGDLASRIAAIEAALAAGRGSRDGGLG